MSITSLNSNIWICMCVSACACMSVCVCERYLDITKWELNMIVKVRNRYSYM